MPPNWRKTILVSFREIQSSGRILTFISLLKAGLDYWAHDDTIDDIGKESSCAKLRNAKQGLWKLVCLKTVKKLLTACQDKW